MEANDLITEELEQTQPTKMPNFLKVLCILTFVGSGFAILGGLVNLMMSGFQEQSLRMTQEVFDNDFFGMNIEESIRWTKYSNISNIVGGLLGLTGALLMWKLKKIGFPIYVVSWIIPIVVSFFALKYMLSGMFASLGNFAIVANVIIAGAFITMYAVNYKHLK